SRKCFQRSRCWVLSTSEITDRHLGRTGLRINRMCASCGSRLALRELHLMHEHTMFSQVVLPPRSRGITWSRFNSSVGRRRAQYWHVFLSRSNTLPRVSFSSFEGSLSNHVSRITRGSRITVRGVCTASISSIGGLLWEKSIQSMNENTRKSSSL